MAIIRRVTNPAILGVAAGQAGAAAGRGAVEQQVFAKQLRDSSAAQDDARRARYAADLAILQDSLRSNGVRPNFRDRVRPQAPSDRVRRAPGTEGPSFAQQAQVAREDAKAASRLASDAQDRELSAFDVYAKADRSDAESRTRMARGVAETQSQLSLNAEREAGMAQKREAEAEEVARRRSLAEQIRALGPSTGLSSIGVESLVGEILTTGRVSATTMKALGIGAPGATAAAGGPKLSQNVTDIASMIPTNPEYVAGLTQGKTIGTNEPTSQATDAQAAISNFLQKGSAKEIKTFIDSKAFAEVSEETRTAALAHYADARKAEIAAHAPADVELLITTAKQFLSPKGAGGAGGGQYTPQQLIQALEQAAANLIADDPDRAERLESLLSSPEMAGTLQSIFKTLNQG